MQGQYTSMERKVSRRDCAETRLKVGLACRSWIEWEFVEDEAAGLALAGGGSLGGGTAGDAAGVSEQSGKRLSIKAMCEVRSVSKFSSTACRPGTAKSMLNVPDGFGGGEGGSSLLLGVVLDEACVKLVFDSVSFKECMRLD